MHFIKFSLLLVFIFLMLSFIFVFFIIKLSGNILGSVFKYKENKNQNKSYKYKNYSENINLFGFDPSKDNNTKNSEVIDIEIIKETFVVEYINKIINTKVDNLEIKESLSKLIEILKEVDGYLIDHADKSKDIKLLCDYYIPELIKNLEAFYSVSNSSFKNYNVEELKNEILETTNMITGVFKTILQEFYDNVMLNASASLDAIKANIKMKGYAK